MNRLLHNSKVLWVISIIVAILLWMYVVTDQNPRTFDHISDIPVEFFNAESLEERGLVISEPQDYTVDIRVYGRRSQLFSLNKSSIRAHVDVSQLNNKGTHYLPIVITGIPSEVELSRKDPDAIQITVDAIVNQPRDINVVITGEPAEDMAAISYEMDQDTAHLDGPEDTLNQVDQVVAYMDISGASEDIHRSVPLVALNSDGEEVTGISIMPENVEITVPIQPTKTVPITTNITGEPSEGYEIMDISINPSSIRIGASTEQLDEVESIQTEEINISEETGSFEREVELILPQGILVQDSEQVVTLSVTMEEYVQEEMEISDIDITNLEEGFNVQEDIIEEPIMVRIIGKEDDISALDHSAISLYINASNLEEGEHNVELQVELPNNITLGSISPNRITINIQEDQGQENQENN